MLTPRQEQAVLAVISSPNVRAAARKAGVGEATLFRWLRCRAFKQRLEEQQRRLAEESVVALAHRRAEQLQPV